ncbi:MAG: hypothetical protein RL095_3983 [Verrucomicrobiota bacterium]
MIKPKNYAGVNFNVEHRVLTCQKFREFHACPILIH